MLTGFSFRATEAGRTELLLKTRAGDIAGPYEVAEPLEAVLVILDDGSTALDVLRDAPLPAGMARYALQLRARDDPFEALHDAVAACRFFTDFGIDRLVLAGHASGAGAALAAVCGVAGGVGAIMVAPTSLPASVPTLSRPAVLADTSVALPDGIHVELVAAVNATILQAWLAVVSARLGD